MCSLKLLMLDTNAGTLRYIKNLKSDFKTKIRFINKKFNKIN